MRTIRNYRPDDENSVIEILKEPGGHHLTNDKVDFEGFQEVYVYDEGQGAIGFVCIEIHEQLSQIACYVSPQRRREGIGEKLYEYGKSRLEKLDPNTIWLFFRNDVGNSAEFYQKRGAKPWYAYHHMFYDKQFRIRPELDEELFDEVLSCNSKYHDTYIEERAKAFYSINKMIDSRPYDERERKDDLMKCEEEGWDPSLCVVTGNTPAKCLYEQCGFKIEQTLEMNRIFSKNKTPDLRGPIGG